MTGTSSGREVAIVGIYATRQAKVIHEHTSLSLCLEAAEGALQDAGLTRHDVDGVALEWPGPGGTPGDSGSWARIFGRTLRWTSDAWTDTAGIRGAMKAAAAIAAGHCETVVLGGGRAGDNRRRRTANVAAGWHAGRDGAEFVEIWGPYMAPAFGLVAQRHMAEFGTKPEHLAEVAATIRNNGFRNPEAVMYGVGPYTPDSVLASPVVASPFHALDLCLVAQGGAAMVLTTMERARDLKTVPVLIRGAASEIARGSLSVPPLYREIGQIGRDACKAAFGQASVSLTDVDVFCLYDPNSFEVIRQFEVLGACGEGEGGPFVEGGTIGPTGPYPTNLDGGLLSHSWNGIQQLTLRLIEAVRQLRGTAQLQVPGAQVALVSNVGSAPMRYDVAILTRE